MRRYPGSGTFTQPRVFDNQKKKNDDARGGGGGLMGAPGIDWCITTCI